MNNINVDYFQCEEMFQLCGKTQDGDKVHLINVLLWLSIISICQHQYLVVLSPSLNLTLVELNLEFSESKESVSSNTNTVYWEFLQEGNRWTTNRVQRNTGVHQHLYPEHHKSSQSRHPALQSLLHQKDSPQSILTFILVHQQCTEQTYV